jgi:hypothetical protein
MIEGRNKFARITCRACGAMCPEENWNRRATLAAQPAEPTMDTVLRNAARRSATVIHPGRLAAQPAEPVTHDPAIRWNFDASDTHLLVCREDHDKGDKCEYKQLHPSEVLAIVNRLRISAIELTFRSAAPPAPAAVPLTDEKIDHTLATTLDEFARTTRGMSHALDVNADITANSRLRRMFARAVLAAGDKP